METRRRNLILEELKEKHSKLGLQKFIYDGIVNEELWNKGSNKKICFFLKEAYLKNGDESANLCQWLNEYDMWRMWWVVSDWIYGINNTTNTIIPAFDEEMLDKTALANERVRSSAIINVKKSNGKANSEYSELEQFAKNDREFIKRQFEEIKPEIIVCGNTVDLFEIVYGYDSDIKDSYAEYNEFKIDHDDFNKKGYVLAGDTIILNYCHPANRFMRMGKYYALCALYQQALIEKEKTKK